MEEGLRVFKTKWFVRFARSERVPDSSLLESIQRANRGLVDADLGGGVIKQRIARLGRGRSGGYRMLIAYSRDTRAVFLYAFAKNARDNIDKDELETLRDISTAWLTASASEIARAIDAGVIEEIDYGEKET